MPLYWFHLDLPTQPHVLAERLRSLARPAPKMEEYWSRMWTWTEPMGPPFIGRANERVFVLRRDIRGRNSFLPRIRGRLLPTQSGARVNIIMFLHPITALFMAVWLGTFGYGVATSFNPGALFMLICGVALTVSCFFPEAFKAKRLLIDALLNSNQAHQSS